VTQLKRQLEKIIDVVKVSEIPAEGEV